MESHAVNGPAVSSVGYLAMPEPLLFHTGRSGELLSVRGWSRFLEYGSLAWHS